MSVAPPAEGQGTPGCRTQRALRPSGHSAYQMRLWAATLGTAWCVLVESSFG